MTIGERIKNRREQLGMTQDDLAQLLNYKSRSSINKIELGKHDLPQTKIKAFADALRTTPSALMGWESMPPVEKPLEPDEKVLLEVYRKLDQEGKDAVLNLVKALVPIAKRGVK